jgi:uncharacterized protein
MASDTTGASNVNPPSRPRTLPFIDGQMLKLLTEAGFTWLKTNQQIVNALNVFPVPDGDTGTNMVLTMQAAWDEIVNSPDRNIGKIAHGIAHGALMGARGNSGVILSQLWRGFARALDSHDVMDAGSMARAFSMARDTAYKGVVRPVEGTILTVAKDGAAACDLAATHTNDLIEIISQVVQAMDRSVQSTPELLPVLREAGVVDSGGKGLFFIIEGMLRHLQGLPLDIAVTTVRPLAALELENTLDSIEPGQDFEVVVDFRPNSPLDLENFYNNLQQMGTSIQVGEGDGIYRMHIHVPTDKRYEPIDYTMSLGTITKVAIENLMAQMEDIERRSGRSKLTLAPVEPGHIAVVAVAPGPGIARVFASLGASAIVEGGQTMNPSTQEIINAFENLPTNKVIILPNNKNIILAAKAATELTVKDISVVPSRSVPQGLAAMLRLSPGGEIEKVSQEMAAALDDVETGEVTIATRSVEIDGVTIQEGNVIALHNGKLVLSTSTIEEAVIKLLEKAHADHFELITLFAGADISKREVDRISDLVRARFPDQEIEVQDGGQPHYPFIISIE